MALSAHAPWRRFYGSTHAQLHYPDLTMYQLVRRTAEEAPNATALIFFGKKTRYAAFLKEIDDAARGLYALGIRKGDCVGICMPNSPQALCCFYALNRLGAVANMIHPLSAPQEIAFYLEAAGSKAVLTLDTFYHTVRKAASCPVLIARLQDELPFPMNLAYPMTKDGRAKLPKSGYTLWTDCIRGGKDTLLPDDCAKADDCAAILYSGGTTGTTKGIRLSNRSFNALALQTIAMSGFGSVKGMKMLSVMPIFHGFGLGIGIHTPLIGGASCVLVPRFSVKGYSAILKKQKPELIPGVPTLFEALLRSDDLKNADLSFLKGIFCGGDNLNPDLKQRVDAFLRSHGCREQIREGYGATECIAAACLTPRHIHREGSIGIPYPDMYFQIVKPGTCQEVSAGTDGEICISGPTVMLGYLDDADEKSSALQVHDDGKLWLHTGDLGAMDEDGFVYFRGRLKRIIVTSGYNVYPAQIESILCRHEKVADCCVIGVPDAYRGQRVKAYIVPESGIAPDEALRQELLAYCREQIARFAMPRELEFKTALPRTTVGKVAYRVLEAENTGEDR